MRLHAYGRSSASFRVRIALRLKSLDVETITHDLSRNAHLAPAYRAINPQGLLPSLEDGPVLLTQSLAIIEYIDAKWPDPPLLPADLPGRARVRALAQIVAADTHPLTARRVAAYLRDACGQDEAAVRAWQCHWLHEAFSALELHLATSPVQGRFCHGDAPTLADVALVPQAVAARRLSFPVSDYGLVEDVVSACLALPAFREANPDAVGPEADPGRAGARGGA